MPGMYSEGDYDLAGFCVGAVERDKVLTGRDIAPGDVILGLASSGVHSNGFSLVRRIIADRGWNLDERHPWAEGRTLGEVLLEPTRIYVRSLLPLVQQGTDQGPGAHHRRRSARKHPARPPGRSPRGRRRRRLAAFPPVFKLLSEGGNVEPAEMVRTFNCGIGMVAIVGAADADEVRTAPRRRRRNGLPNRPNRGRPARLHR